MHALLWIILCMTARLKKGKPSSNMPADILRRQWRSKTAALTQHSVSPEKRAEIKKCKKTSSRRDRKEKSSVSKGDKKLHGHHDRTDYQPVRMNYQPVRKNYQPVHPSPLLKCYRACHMRPLCQFRTEEHVTGDGAVYVGDMVISSEMEELEHIVTAQSKSLKGVIEGSSQCYITNFPIHQHAMHIATCQPLSVIY